MKFPDALRGLQPTRVCPPLQGLTPSPDNPHAGGSLARLPPVRCLAGPAWGTVKQVSAPEPLVPDPPAAAPAFARAATSTVAATAEILLAVFAFVVGLALLLVIPGLQSAIFWLLDATFGRPLLTPEKVRQVHGIVLTPLAVLASALIYGWLGRRLDLVGEVEGDALLGEQPAVGARAERAVEEEDARRVRGGRAHEQLPPFLQQSSQR